MDLSRLAHHPIAGASKEGYYVGAEGILRGVGWILRREGGVAKGRGQSREYRDMTWGRVVVRGAGGRYDVGITSGRAWVILRGAEVYYVGPSAPPSP